jgi:acetylornithine deacetylase/succinyl-diaminopimelate desuccinylase-like protein
MHQDLIDAVDELFPTLEATLESLVRIPSVSAAGYDPTEVRRSATAVAELLADAGLEGVRLLEIPGAHPAVFGELPASDGAPTVLLYAHHDVQPPGPAEQWDVAPFEPEVIDGRLYGRGASDDKAGIVVHLGAIQALAASREVGVKVFVEGEEEVGSAHLEEFLRTYRDELAADVVVIADSGNHEIGVPTLTTSLRGLVDCEVEVRVLGDAVHSGMYGGAVPDALMSMSRLLATLHDDAGEVAIEGLVSTELAEVPMPDDELLATAGAVDGLELIGTGPVSGRLWGKPAVSILAIDAPPTSEAINQIVPVARAKVSMRIPPDQSVDEAMDALAGHLEGHAPWGARVTVTRGASGDAHRLDTTGPAYDAFRTAFAEAWGAETIEVGVGGSIPFVAALSEIFPDASILLTGVGDPSSRWHGPNESQDLEELRRGIIAEAIALRLLADLPG